MTRWEERGAFFFFGIRVLILFFFLFLDSHSNPFFKFFFMFTAFQLAPAGDVSQQEEAASVADGTLRPPQRLLQWQDLHSVQGQAPGHPLQEPHLHRPDREGLQPQLARRHQGLHLHQGESHVSPGITATPKNRRV